MQYLFQPLKVQCQSSFLQGECAQYLQSSLEDKHRFYLVAGIATTLSLISYDADTSTANEEPSWSCRKYMASTASC
jgi:hypothetical protein